MSIDLGKIEVEDYKEWRYQFIGKFHNGLALVQNRRGLYGYIDETLEERIPCQYDYAADFSEWLALVNKDKKYYFIDVNGIVRIDNLDEYKAIRTFHDGRAVVANKDYAFGYIDRMGREVIPCIFYNARDFSEGLAVVDCRSFDRKSEELTRYINTEGVIQSLLTGDYQIGMSSQFINGIAPVIKTSKRLTLFGPQKTEAFINTAGKVFDKKEEVDKLRALYESGKDKTDKEIEINSLINYCARIYFLGQALEITATSEEMLAKKKRETFAEIKTAIENFSKGEIETKLSEKPSTLVKK